MFPHFDTQARIAMMQAHDTARELGHSDVGPDHVLLGLLTDVRGDAYAVLTRHGLQYAAARDLVARDHAERPAPTETPATDEVVEDDLDRDREALLGIGIDLDKLRDSVRDRFGEDLTEGWGQRRSRRGERGGLRGRRRGPGGPGFGPGGPGFGPGGPGPESGPESGPADPGFGPGGPGRGRRGPRSARFGGESLSPAMREVMADLVHQTRAEAHEGRAEWRRERADRPDREERRGGRGRPELDESRRGPRPQLTAGRLLAAILRSADPAVAVVVAASDDPAALRADVDALAGHSTA